MFNNIDRRKFLKHAALLVAASGITSSCEKKNKFTCTIIDDHSSVGHMIRDGEKPSPSSTSKIPILIVGAGVSGLSAAYHLQKAGREDYLLLDLADKPGGNAIAGKNNISAYPWAAHYLPIVNNSNTELLDFLKDHDIITSFNQDGLPVYNDYYLCFDPEERLFINGHWQDGLIPDFGVKPEEKQEIQRFLKLVNRYKFALGEDGKPAFNIPVQNSSEDEAFRKLDLMSFQDFLNENNFHSPALLWYLNYCCKDDYGSSLSDTSAYAGLHYFCARRAKAANAESSAVLTWPEGNAFLADKLYSTCAKNVCTNQLVTSVDLINDNVEVEVFDVAAKSCKKFICDHVILCSPQYVNNRILSKKLLALRNVPDLFDYNPWMVANISLSNLPEYKGEPLSWDNVLYGSPSLGYVNACHQHLDSHNNKDLVITYYLPYTGGSSKELRKRLREKKADELSKEIIADLQKAHPGIESYISNIEIKLWGHGMIKPVPGFIFNRQKNESAKPVNNKLFFAHSDLSGISIFEEAFHQGSKAAKELLNTYDILSKA